VAVLRDDAPGLELDDHQRSSLAADDPAGHAVPDREPLERRQVGEGAHACIMLVG
jgi:hypothetical protein